MSNQPWIDNYPPEVPKKIDPNKYASLADLLEESFANFGALEAYENMGKTFTFSQMEQYSTNFAAYFQQELGLKPGDAIAIQMPNILQYPIVLWGALRAGLVVVNTNPLYTPEEMKHQFTDSGARAIIILANFAGNLEKIIQDTQIKHVVVTQLGDMLGGLKGSLVNFVVKNVKKMVPAYNLPGAIPFKQALKMGGKATYTKPDITSDNLAFLQYTGGTTGVSKGAMLTHGNLIANIEQIKAWLAPGVLEIGKEIWIAALPMYHIFALNAHGLTTASIGAKNILITNPRDMKAFVKELAKHPYTLITGVNTLFNGLLNNEGFRNLDHTTMKIALAGGMALQQSVCERWQQVTGILIAEAYGLTETSPGVCINPLDGKVRVGSIGLPIPDTDIVLLDDNGKEVALGEPGELCCKGPQVMSGYWQREEETKNCFINGYFRTGDIATMDKDGFFKIVDRKKEMILVSGFNVFPNEVEDAIAHHEKVLEVAAIAVPDKKSTEAVKVYIVKSDDSLTEDEIRTFARERLTAYKCPKYVAFTDELPKSNVGKILRRIIKEKDLETNTYN